MTYQRPQFQILINRLAEPHRFIQVVAGTRPVGKTASDGLFAQVCERLNHIIRLGRQHFAHEASPDETTDITTSHLITPAKDAGQVIGYSHSTRLSDERLLSVHPKDNSQVAGYKPVEMGAPTE